MSSERTYAISHQKRHRRRQAQWAISLKLILAALLALSLTPGAIIANHSEAYAAQDSFTVDRKHNPYISINGSAFYEATVDGATYAVYCDDPWASEGPLGTYRLTDIQQGTPRQNYIIARGYPNSNDIGGETWDDMDALQITQMASWMDGDPSVDYDYMVAQTQRFGGAGVPRNLYDAAVALFEAANAYGGGDPSIDGAAMTAISDQHAQGAQRILLANLRPTGNLTLVKSSANAEITNGNPCYRLDGAEFAVIDSGGNAVGTIVTDDNGQGTLADLKAGSYTVQETKAPEGYLLNSSAQTVQIEPGATSTVQFEDVPLACFGNVAVGKIDADLKTATPQGAARIGGAEFTFSFYPGYYSNPAELPGSPARTWTMKAGTNGEASLFYGGEMQVGGSDFYVDAAGAIAVPLGTIAVEETKAPEGYVLDNGSGGAPKVFMFHVTAQPGSDKAHAAPINCEAAETSSTSGTPLASDTVKRGNVEVVKTDSATKDGAAQGGATLAGAEFEIVNTSNRAVISPQTGKEVTKGNTVCTIISDENGRASTTNSSANGWSIPSSFHGKALAYGTYTIRETKAPEGYLVNNSWSADITITEDGQLATYSLGDEVKRGDFEFSKVDGSTMKRLAGVPFLVTSKTTGESHVIVSDDNGMVSTKSDWNAHTASTNASDRAVSQSENGYDVDESQLDQTAGIWFFGHEQSDTGAPVTNALGALPYDTYLVEELGCSANENLSLATFEVVVSRHMRSLNLGTIDDNPAPAIGTTLLDDQGTHTLAAEKTLVVTDEIAYSNFSEGDYVFEGELHALDENGEDAGVIATGSKEAHLGSGSGTVTVTFEVDTSEHSGAKLVAFERCYDSTGKLIAAHEDLEDAYQTVSVPTIATTLTDATEGDHEVDATAPICLTDTVFYSGLTPEKTYTMTMTLHRVGPDGEDAGTLLDATGAPVTATAQFTPTSPDGTVDVSATFEIADDGGYDIVAFEELSYHGSIYAVHADIADEPQTVHVTEKPKSDEPEETPISIGTSASDKSSGTHEGIAAQEVAIVDSVAYAGLTVGTEYTVTGTLYDRDTNEPYVQPNGERVVASSTFTPESERGSVDVAFTLDGSELAGKSLVAFEQLTTSEEPDKLLATHEDITYANQTVTYQSERNPEPEADSPNPDKPSATPTSTPAASVRPSAKASALPKTGDVIGAALPLLVMSSVFAAAAVAALAYQRHNKKCRPEAQRKTTRK